jgi:hypothetical protein
VSLYWTISFMHKWKVLEEYLGPLSEFWWFNVTHLSG